MSASRSAQRCSAVVSWARVGSPLVSGWSTPDRVGPALVGGPAQRRAGRGVRGGRRRRMRPPEVGEVLGGGDALARRRGGRSPVAASGGRAVAVAFEGAPRGAPPGLGQRRGQDRGDLRPHARPRPGRRARSGDVPGPDRRGDPLPVEHAPLVRLGDQVLGLVVVAVRGLHRPQVDGDAVLLGGHHAGQQVAVPGDQHHVGAGTVAGQFGQLRVHGRVHALLRPPAVRPGERAEPYRHPGHHPQPAVLGLRNPVGCAVEPVDPQQRLPGLQLGAFAQASDHGGVIDDDPGTGRLTGQQASRRAQQIAGVHQDDAAVHVAPLPVAPRHGCPLGFPRVCPNARGL